jgi:CheY-like chemotaxis protein
MQILATLRVLYVEDEVVARRTVAHAFERDGIEIRTAVDGYEGLALAREWQPDLIVMDLMMPVMDGFEAIKALRADKQTWDIPIIAYSASAPDSILPRALRAGVDTFLSKTAPHRDLIAMVRERLRIAA